MISMCCSCRVVEAVQCCCHDKGGSTTRSYSYLTDALSTKSVVLFAKPAPLHSFTCHAQRKLSFQQYDMVTLPMLCHVEMLSSILFPFQSDLFACHSCPRGCCCFYISFDPTQAKVNRGTNRYHTGFMHFGRRERGYF